MSGVRPHQLKLTLLRASLIAALPTACAVGVEPDMTDQGVTSEAGDGTTGGTVAGSLAGTSSSVPKAGTASSSGGSVTNAFGGTSSSGGGGKPNSSTGGTAGVAGAKGGGAGAGGSSAAGGGGGAAAGGAAGGSGGSGTGGSAGTCACPKKVAWADNTNLSFSSGDCLDVAGKTYLYTGKKAQTWANKDCNPTMQLSWCTNADADYNFMACN